MQKNDLKPFAMYHSSTGVFCMFLQAVQQAFIKKQIKTERIFSKKQEKTDKNRNEGKKTEEKER